MHALVTTDFGPMENHFFHQRLPITSASQEFREGVYVNGLAVSTIHAFFEEEPLQHYYIFLRQRILLKVIMGGGISSIPMQIDKETFRKISGGSFNDEIFDANSVAGIMVKLLFYVFLRSIFSLFIFTKLI